MKKHYVNFMSPGSFMAETTTKEIDSWDVNKAIEISENIEERYGAKPYGFYFTTRERKDTDFDSKQVAESGMYYLGGKVRTIAEVEAENNPNDKILLSNMRSNGYNRVISTTKGWAWTQPLKDNDIVLQV